MPLTLEKGLAVRLADWKLLFPLEVVSEIATLPQITPVPGVKSWFMGITNLRGIIISIIDLRHYLSGESTILSPKSRFIVIRSGDWGYGWLVDEIVGMRHFDTQDLASEQDEVDPVLGAYSTGSFHEAGHSWRVLNIERLANDPRFQVVAKKDF